MTALPRAFLLDLDDTILDDSGNTDAYWRGALEAHRDALGAVAPEALHAAIVRARRWYWGDRERHRAGRLDLGAARAEVARLALADMGVDSPSLAASIARVYAGRKDEAMSLLDGAIETLGWLRDAGRRLALLTNGSEPAQRSKIGRFGLAGYFDVVLIEGEVGFGKPDPRIYDLALDGLGVDAVDAWMVGDNLEWDVEGPQRRGIRGVWVDRRGAGLPEHHAVRPHRIVRSLSDLRAEFA